MKLDGTLFAEWFTLCATSDEFLANYNRLSGHRISFALPARTPFERLIDNATGHVPMPKNNPRHMAHFMGFCLDMFTRLPLEPTP